VNKLLHGNLAPLEALLEPWASDGTLTEVIATYALIARRPDGSA